MTPSSAPLALDGVRVVDLSRVLAGPYCGALLGDLGADVIKVEDPGVGDESRTWPPHKDGESAGYLVNNRNKRGIAVNLKEPDGVGIVRRLTASADVLIENFRTGTMEEFGLGYETLARDNPRLVYCSVSAFGRTGPRAEGAGYEALMQAFSGIMSITGEPDGAPVRCGVSFLDLTTGILCAFGVVSALRLRDRSGRGQRVDGSLLETALGLLNFQAEGFLLAGTVPKALGSAHPSLSPYRNFRCRDGQWVFIAGANDRLWRRLVGALGLADMADDPRFATNAGRVAHMDETDALVEAWTRTLGKMEVFARTKAYRIPCAPVRNAPEVMNDPHMHERGMLERIDHPELGEIVVPSTPLRLHGTDKVETRPSPTIGQHNSEIYGGWLGLSAAEIEQLRETGAI